MRQFEQAISGLAPKDLQKVLHGLLGTGGPRDPFERTPPPSRRRSRRGDVVTYQVRMDVTGASPPLWRRLELASNLFLDDLHEVIQAAFGWTDSHLHRFASGPDYYSDDTEYYLCPFEVEEGETGVPEEQVRLDEVLVDAGDVLLYTYDFGDNWQHTIKLEAVQPRTDATPRATCTAGRRPGPTEDCGGVDAYELIVAATDANHPRHAEGAAEFAHLFGEEVDPAGFELTAFDMDALNRELVDLGLDDGLDTELPGPLDDLVKRTRTTVGRRSLLRLIRDASLDTPVLIDAGTAARLVRPYTWLLERVGAGITLTSAGYLPPVHVEAAMAELGMADEWIGAFNRENQTVPVLHLRESAQKTGLLRKHRGTLLPTSRGWALRNDPVGLWWHLAERMPLRSTDACEVQAGLLLLLAVAANVEGPQATVAEMLNALGWMSSDGGEVTSAMAGQAAWDNETVLRRLGGFTGDGGVRRPTTPTAEGVLFARAALRTWPDSKP